MKTISRYKFKSYIEELALAGSFIMFMSQMKFAMCIYYGEKLY